MEPKQILSASLLDIVFDNRNKAYGAYELRVTYTSRVKKILLVVFSLIFLIISAIALANSFRPDKPAGFARRTVVDLIDIIPEEDKPEPLPKPIPPPQVEPPTQTVKYTTPVITDDKDVDQPMPPIDSFSTAKIDIGSNPGDKFDNIVQPPKDPIGIFEKKEGGDDENYIHPVVQIPARYDGNWSKFLLTYLRPETPVDNGAPAGKYTVMIQFVVDKDGNLSDIKALTAHGYGMEQEAIRVLKKATGWKPGIQDGREVKSYHRQPITFEVVGE